MLKFGFGLFAMFVFGFAGILRTALAVEASNPIETKNRADFSENTELGFIGYVGTFRARNETKGNKESYIKLGCQTLEPNKIHHFVINHRSPNDDQKGKEGYFLVETFFLAKRSTNKS
jgi:hypothetical protein